MQVLIRLIVATALIGSDAAQAASFSADDARYRRSEAAWKHIMASVCVGCGGPPPPLEIVRATPQLARPDAPGGTTGSTATASMRAPLPPAVEPDARAERPAAASRTRVIRVARRHLRSATRLRRKVELARLHRLRERRRLAQQLARRRQEARRALRLRQVLLTPDPRRGATAPASLGLRSGPAPIPRPIREVSALMPDDRSASRPVPLPLPPEPPARNCPSKRDDALIERSRPDACRHER